MPIDRSRAFVVIAAFNESQVIRDVVAGVAASYPNVVVVDDGSGDATSTEAAAGGAVVLRHPINRGQGAAIQTGITYALRDGCSAVVTFDADGQHRVEDIPRLLDALDEQPADVAIGSRFLGANSKIPTRRRLILHLAVWFMRLTSGVALSDAHNGLRTFTRDAASRIDITLDGMAHASEVVDQIRASDLRVAEVPVVVRYSEYSMRKGQSSGAAFKIAFDYLFQRWFR